MDGFAVVSTLRQSATLSRIPLLVYSALDVEAPISRDYASDKQRSPSKSRGSLADSKDTCPPYSSRHPQGHGKAECCADHPENGKNP